MERGRKRKHLRLIKTDNPDKSISDAEKELLDELEDEEWSGASEEDDFLDEAEFDDDVEANVEHYVPPLTEEEQTINMQIDEDLLAILEHTAEPRAKLVRYQVVAGNNLLPTATVQAEVWMRP